MTMQTNRPFDLKLSKELTDIHAQLMMLQTDLFASRPECVCDQDGLCAHHAEMAAQLQAARKHLRFAIRSDEAVQP